ncbi:MAG TPA: hypothetical protein VNT27_05530, partial [Propionibacteriaceae bacterium]|nr:hypothetical protein [Propionibacteriaceae bacterium]
TSSHIVASWLRFGYLSVMFSSASESRGIEADVHVAEPGQLPGCPIEQRADGGRFTMLRRALTDGRR